jgi:hypothetical protein
MGACFIMLAERLLIVYMLLSNELILHLELNIRRLYAKVPWQLCHKLYLKFSNNIFLKEQFFVKENE